MSDEANSSNPEMSNAVMSPNPETSDETRSPTIERRKSRTRTRARKTNRSIGKKFKANDAEADRDARNIVRTIFAHANIPLDEAVFEHCVISTRSLLDNESKDVAFVLENKVSIRSIKWNVKMAVSRIDQVGKPVTLLFYVVFFCLFTFLMGYLVIEIVKIILNK